AGRLITVWVVRQAAAVASQAEAAASRPNICFCTGRGEKSLLCDPGSELRLRMEGERLKCEDNKWEQDQHHQYDTPRCLSSVSCVFGQTGPHSSYFFSTFKTLPFCEHL
ncbi:unnamed protein product, partial [Laminaria digitata]